MADEMGHDVVNDGRAIGGEGVVEAGCDHESVRLTHISQEQRTFRRDRHLDPVQVVILTAYVGPDPDDIPLIRCDDTEFEFLEEPPDFGEVVALAATNLN